MKLVWITSAVYKGDYRLEITFSDGKQGIVDFKPYLERIALFEPLKVLENFKNFQLDGWTLSWMDGQLDIAPESLYEKLP